MEFNCLILGDKDVGKTSYINRIINGDFTSQQKNDISLRLKTNKGIINFNFFDNSLPKIVDCVIIMFDINHSESFSNILIYHKYILDTFGNIPFVICGNKCDKYGMNRNVQKLAKFLVSNGNLNKNYYTISAKSLYNSHTPLLFLLEKLLNDGPITLSEYDQEDFDYYHILPIPIPITIISTKASNI